MSLFLTFGSFFEEFFKTYQDRSELSSKSMKKYFKKSLEEPENRGAFFQFISHNFWHLIRKQHKTVYKKSIKFICLLIQILKSQELKSHIKLLAKLISRDYFLEIETDKVEFSLNEQSIPIPQTLTNKIVVLTFATENVFKSRLEEAHQFILPSQVESLKKNLPEGFYQFSVLDSEFNIQKQCNYMRNFSKQDDIEKMSKNRFIEKKRNEKYVFGRNDLLVDISKHKNVDNSVLLELASLAKANKRKIFWKLSLEKVSKTPETLYLSNLIGNSESMFHFYQSLKNFKKLIVKGSKKYKINGIFLEDFMNNLFWNKIEINDSVNYEMFQELSLKNWNKVRLDNLFTELKLINPFYAVLTKRMHLLYPVFQFASDEIAHSSKLGWKLLFKPFASIDFNSNSLFNMMNFLNSEFHRELNGQLICDKFLLYQRSSQDVFKDSLLKKFYSFIKNKLPFYVIGSGSDLFVNKLSTDHASIFYSQIIQSLKSPIYYLPIFISEAEQNNSILGCVLISDKRILIFIEKFFELENAEVTLKLSLLNVYRVLKNNFKNEQIYKWSINVKSDKELKKMSLYEFLKNQVSISFKMNKFFMEFEIIPYNKKIKNKDLKIEKSGRFDQKNAKIKAFLEKLKNKEEAIGQILLRFVKLLKSLNIDSIKKVKDFMRAPQIFGKKNNYEKFGYLFITLSEKFETPKNCITFSKKELKEIHDWFKLGSIGVITPEYGEFVKVGGLAVMIEDLCNGLANENEKIFVVLPYYNFDKQGKTNYLLSKNVVYQKNITISSRYINYEIGVHLLQKNNINFYFLHNEYLFPEIYKSVMLLVQQRTSNQTNKYFQYGSYESSE